MTKIKRLERYLAAHGGTVELVTVTDGKRIPAGLSNPEFKRQLRVKRAAFRRITFADWSRLRLQRQSRAIAAALSKKGGQS